MKRGPNFAAALPWYVLSILSLCLFLVGSVMHVDTSDSFDSGSSSDSGGWYYDDGSSSDSGWGSGWDSGSDDSDSGSWDWGGGDSGGWDSGGGDSGGWDSGGGDSGSW